MSFSTQNNDPERGRPEDMQPGRAQESSRGGHATEHPVVCRSIMTRSGISGIDYTVNPYVGCTHNCVYCYARFMARHTPHQGVWGTFCDPKVNAPDVCRKQACKIRTGRVSLSSVTDPYQPLEARYQLTRRILEELAQQEFFISILTKSPLVLRDSTVFRKLGRDRCEVGFSINTLDENVRRHFEPGAPSIRSRIEALQALHRSSIRTWLFIAPVLPLLTSESVTGLLERVRPYVSEVLVDRLNIKCGNWKPIADALQKGFPSLLPSWRRMLFSGGEDPFQEAGTKIHDFCSRSGMSVRFC
jgi:DNA repair photolyase